jgi:hypothetical protein
MANSRSWEKIIRELRKCVLVCANCHREIHEGLTKIPEGALRFDEAYCDYKALEKQQRQTPCPICNKLKPEHQITCSRVCAAKRARKVDWDKFDLSSMVKKMSIVSIAETIGVSDTSVRKQLIKLGLK